MKKLLLFSGLTALSAACAWGDIRAVTPVSRENDGKWWLERRAEKLPLVKAGGAPIVFIGDSITHHWDTRHGQQQWKKYFADGKYRAISLGYGGDRTEHLLWRIDNGELDGYEAKAVVLMIGTNNTGHFAFRDEPPADTIIGIHAVIAKILEKQPKARVVLQPIFPRGADVTDEGRRRNALVNREIMKFADGRRVVWCDFTDRFLTADGRLPTEMMPDLLHPGPLGYEIWANSIIPTLDRVLAAGEGEIVPSVYSSRLDASVLRTADCTDSSFPQTRIEYNFPQREGSWFERMAMNRRQIAESNGEIDIVFIGDSITHYWDVGEGSDTSTEIVDLRKKYSILNCAYGGDQTQNQLWLAENGLLDGYRTKLVMMMIGTNNTGGGKPPAETFAAIQKLVKTVQAKQPQAKVLLLNIFPRNVAANKLRIRNESVNTLINTAWWGPDVIVKDIGANFVDEKGDTIPELYDDERLHLMDKGFTLWRKAVEPIFKEVVGK